MISTIEQCVKHLFSGQNTQQLILPLIKLYSEYSEIQVEFFLCCNGILYNQNWRVSINVLFLCFRVGLKICPKV